MTLLSTFFRSARILVLTGLPLILLSACCDHPVSTELLDPAKLAWVTYTNPELGYSLDHPKDFGVGTRGSEARFTFHGVPARVAWVTPEEGKNRGLWSRHEPAGQATLGGRAARRYVYDHGDGPLCSRTVAYVVDYQGKELGLELRTPAEPDAVQQRMLASFRWRAE